jgi:hypothetical protein
MADKATLREIIVNEVTSYHRAGGASFVELEQAFDMVSAEYRGDYALQNGPIVYWTGWSTEAIDALNDAVQAGEVHLASAPLLIYMVDGKMLDLPIVKGAYRYKRDHWLPTVVRPSPGSDDG